MNYKRCLFVLLAGAVLLVPVTSHYAISFQEIKDNISKFFSEDTFKKIVPGALVLAIFGGLYYWLTKKRGDGGGAGEKKPSLIEEHMSSFAPSLTQFNVYSQFNGDGGGAASCGYQTLLRGMQVISAKSEYESNEVLEKILTDPAPIAAYIGKGGEWRNDIIARRKNQELKKILHEKLMATLITDGDDKAIGLYKSSLGFLEDIIIARAKDPEHRIQPYDFTDEAIQFYVKKSLGQLKNKENEDLIEKLQQPDIISKYFNFDQMRKSCLSKDFILILPTIMDELNKRPDLQEDFAGEWLSDGELEYLWENHRVDIIPIMVNCGFKAIANFELVDNPEYPREFDEVAFYIDENVKPLLNKKQQMFQLFGLGTMRQTGEVSGTRGHWYPLVMHQNKEGERNYCIMDSANNRDRTQDANAWKIINLIEKAANVI